MLGYAKNFLYMNKIHDLNNFKTRTRDSAGQVPRDMLQRVQRGVELSLDISRVTNGAHVETYDFLKRILGLEV
jgi:hypothetical protein